ncbi:MAG: CarD family transcriptional regulator [Mogibacterium sp.]|nr:CarD family transcriptional regulator [Mogibacterium sp.]
MFDIGTNIAYPMHGAGTILNIEEKEVLGEKRDYYFVNLPHSKMTVMIPVDNSEAVGVRPIIGPPEIPSVLDVLGAPSDPMPGNWNRRYRDNTEKLRTGDIYIVASVVRNLVRSDRTKKLSTGEKKLLGTAKQILESELMLAVGITREEADELVESHI